MTSFSESKRKNMNVFHKMRLHHVIYSVCYIYSSNTDPITQHPGLKTMLVLPLLFPIINAERE